MDVALRTEYVAVVRAAKYAEVRSRIKGLIDKVWIDEGAHVHAGQTLFTVNVRARQQQLAVARAAVAAADAELDTAEIEAENTEFLAGKNIVSAAEVKLAQTKVAMLRAKRDESRANARRVAYELERAAITAPFDGVVDRIPRKAGSAIEENELLTTIADASDVYAYFALTEREYLSYVRSAHAAKPAVAFLLADGTPLETAGTIDAVAGAIDAQTGTISFRARFANRDGVLKHGSSGKVVLATQLHGALVVPQKSTFEVQGDVYLYVLDAANVVHARKISIEDRLDDTFVVGDGLTATDRFVIEGVQKLKDGARIQVRG
jgi:membrane fusion protein (multidrug efflux system)